MTLGEKKAKHKLSGGHDCCGIKTELEFLNTKQYLKSSDTHEKDNEESGDRGEEQKNLMNMYSVKCQPLRSCKCLTLAAKY